MTRILIVSALLVPSAAFACGGKKDVAAAGATSTEQTTADAHADIDPTHCAKKSELVGANCSYATGMMAQRVLEEGKSWSYTGSLAKTSNELDSRVAAPYTIGPDSAINVVANEVVETLVDEDAASVRVSLTGKLLEVDGVTYFVATEFRRANS